MTSDPAREPSERGARRTTRLLDKAEFDAVFSSWRDRIRAALEGSSQESSGQPGLGPAVLDRDPEGRSAWALVGIKRRGAMLARRLWNELHASFSPLLYGEVDISLYRDDYHIQTATPRVLGTEISFRIDGVKILLVDDVLYTGRTVRAAMDLILDFGRPRGIALAVFVDRGHRELPIAANFVGKEIPTERDDRVRVRLEELAEADSVELVRVLSGEGSTEPSSGNGKS